MQGAIKGDQIRNGYITPAFSWAQKWADWLQGFARGSTCTVGAPCVHRAKYLNNFLSRWSTERGVVGGTW